VRCGTWMGTEGVKRCAPHITPP